VFLDSSPKKAWPGKVIEIDPMGSFTPENIYFKDDRVKQVFGIKIAISDPQGFPKPGMPADADIILDSN
jgi:HlyD family secretion protein